MISRNTNSPLPRLGRADVPETLELVLSTSMAKSPESRYSSAHAFALALQRIQTELNLSVTPFEVLEEPGHGDEQHPDDNFEETRVRSIASIDPDASGTATTGSAPTFPARTFPSTIPVNSPQPAQVHTAPPRFQAPAPSISDPDPAESTVLRGWQPSGRQDDLGATVTRSHSIEAPGVEAVPPPDHGKRNLWLAVSGAAVLVVAIVVGVVLGAQAQPKVLPSEAASKQPADPLDDGGVPDVEGLHAERSSKDRNIIVFTWKNPQPKAGDAFKWRIKSAKGDGPYQSTNTPNAFMSGLEDPPICIQAIIVREDGAASPEGPDSIACLEE
jgi:hypothetical protein